MMPLEEIGLAAGTDVLAMEPPEDKELVLAFKRGEDGSYQAIYERYKPRVRGICSRMLDHSHDAEEAQQETFMRVYTALPKFNGRYQLGAWVSRIATNVCLDHIRSKGRKPADSASNEMLVDLATDPDENGPEEQLLRGDERNRVREVLAKLAPNHRAALALREFEGMSYSDIAIALNMTEPQVKALIHRARKAFKKQWAPGLAAFLPWRLIARARRFSSHYDAPPQISDAAASSVHFATSCSAALQQCGQFVSERVATTVTALVVGTAAISSGVASTPPDQPTPQVVMKAASADEPRSAVRGKVVRKKRVVKEKQDAPVVAPTEAGPEEQAPPSDPEPSPTSTPGPSGGKGQSKQPVVQPTYAPVAPALGWDRGQPIPVTTPSSNEMTLDCAARTFSQELETVIHDGAAQYPVRFVLDLADGANFDLYVQKDGREVWYNGSASDVVGVGSGRETMWTASGSYSAMGAVDPRDVGLPLYGRFSFQLAIDCVASVPVNEKLSLTAE